jgi:hypothetical protein
MPCPFLEFLEATRLAIRQFHSGGFEICMGSDVARKRSPAMSTPRRSRSGVSSGAPSVRTLFGWVDAHEKMLGELKNALEIQFVRIAQLQAQFDKLESAVGKRTAS